MKRLDAGLPLACTVRGCGERLARSEKSLVCARGHAFDIARSGYVNLLQPQDRHSLAAGDAREEIESRARLFADGFGRALDAELLRVVSQLELRPLAVAVDLGTGSGERFGALCAARGLAGIGIDLASVAMERAARRHPGLTWVVANADRHLPLADRSVDLVLSLHGRRNPSECARVLAPDGQLLVALPAPDDLIELRALVQGQRSERERVSAFLAEHEASFVLRQRSEARERLACTRAQLHDLLAGTYRGARRSAAEAVERLSDLSVTLASDVLLLARADSD